MIKYYLVHFGNARFLLKKEHNKKLAEKYLQYNTEWIKRQERDIEQYMSYYERKKLGVTYTEIPEKYLKLHNIY